MEQEQGLESQNSIEFCALNEARTYVLEWSIVEFGVAVSRKL